MLNQGDSRTIPNIHLKIGSEATAVTVISGADAEIPVDNAEISATLNNELVDSATLTGRNAAELIKMMPGVTFSGNTSSYNSQVTGTNNGPAGSFSTNGTQPYGSTDVYLDGANLIDPGNAGTQVANINQDMTDSVKFLSASYGAEYAKGPAVLQAFSKSGGQKFHGEAISMPAIPPSDMPMTGTTSNQNSRSGQTEFSDATELLLCRRQHRRADLLPAFQPQPRQAVLLGWLRVHGPAPLQLACANERAHDGPAGGRLPQHRCRPSRPQHLFAHLHSSLQQQRRMG